MAVCHDMHGRTGEKTTMRTSSSVAHVSLYPFNHSALLTEGARQAMRYHAVQHPEPVIIILNRAVGQRAMGKTQLVTMQPDHVAGWSVTP